MKGTPVWLAAIAGAALVGACAGPRYEVRDIEPEPVAVEPEELEAPEIAVVTPPEPRRQEPPSIDEPPPFDEPGSEPPVMETDPEVGQYERVGPEPEGIAPPPLWSPGSVGPPLAGTVVSSADEYVVIEDDEGARHRLYFDHQSYAWIDGTQIGQGVLGQAIEEGTEVRASFVPIGELLFLRELAPVEEPATADP